MSKQPLERILEELNIAEKLLKENNQTGNLVKPEILHVGPKPIKNEDLQRKVLPVVPIPKIKRECGDFVSCIQLKAIRTALSWTDSAARKLELINRLANTKSQIKHFKKIKKYGKYPN